MKTIASLRIADVLNRFPVNTLGEEDLITTSGRSTGEKLEPTIHVMKYIFPRQFGLHNVFTSAVDSRETVQVFKDYTLREEEINASYKGMAPHIACREKTKIPKRLRIRTVELVRQMQVAHSRCSYTKLLDYYCSSVVRHILT